MNLSSQNLLEKSKSILPPLTKAIHSDSHHKSQISKRLARQTPLYGIIFPV